MGLTIASIVIFVFGTPHLFAGLVWGATPEAAPFSDLRQIKKFVSVEVQTQGTAEKVGLSSGDLTDLTRSAFLNKISGIPLEGSRGPSADGSTRLFHLRSMDGGRGVHCRLPCGLQCRFLHHAEYAGQLMEPSFAGIWAEG